MDERLLKIALSLIPNLGPRLVRRLVAYTGSIEAVFKENKKLFEKVPGIGTSKASGVNTEAVLKAAEEELNYIEKSGVKFCFYLDADYPGRLKECEDGPIILYSKGNVDFNADKILSIVGTRKATTYGKYCTEEIVKYLAEKYPNLIIVSGLAFGIDIYAHKAALKNGIKTIASLGHGFNFMYPAEHASVAAKIKEQGALITEFQSIRKPDPGNFVSRNRIIAGLADATIVVESAEKGGALITADMAASYNRDVFAVPGRGNDTYSRGCNFLIKQNLAALAENGEDIEKALRWFTKKNNPKSIQRSLFADLASDDQLIINYLEKNGDSALDHISFSLNMPVARLSAKLLNLEFNGFVQTLPGKYYRKI